MHFMDLGLRSSVAEKVNTEFIYELNFQLQNSGIEIETERTVNFLQDSLFLL